MHELWDLWKLWHARNVQYSSGGEKEKRERCIARKRALFQFCLNKHWMVKHFTGSSYVTGYYGIGCVRILSLLTKVGESMNGSQNERTESKEPSLQQWNKQ